MAATVVTARTATKQKLARQRAITVEVERRWGREVFLCPVIHTHNLGCGEGRLREPPPSLFGQRDTAEKKRGVNQISRRKRSCLLLGAAAC
jgi:hypothetical protein